MSVWKSIAKDIAAATGDRAELQQQGSVGGGCISQAMRVQYGDTNYFVKLNSANQYDVFDAEAQGLQELRQAVGLRVPEPVCWGEDGESAWLVMENLELGGNGSAAELGEGLAGMHRITQSRFGWHRDNTIGSTPQINTPDDDWIGFWREKRLRFQLELANRNGAGSTLCTRGERLLEEFPLLFTTYQPEASLLHGDLWSGNYAYTREGESAIFDPAVYYGDREADIAMMELFGGFGSEFYAAYTNAWPLDDGYPVRKTLYNLYHILNHYNLFGGGYGSQALGMVDMLLSEF